MSLDNSGTGPHKRFLLIVEDDKHITIVLQEALKPHFRVLCAISYEEAISVMGWARPDVVLLDLILNGQHTGLDVVKWMKKEWLLLPQIVFTTAYISLPGDNNEVWPLLKKPFSLEELYSILNVYEHKSDAQALS